MVSPKKCFATYLHRLICLQALARALYSRRKLLLVDDILSSLDTPTRDHVWNKVFGPHGLIRKTAVTVVLVTHSCKEIFMLSKTSSIYYVYYCSRLIIQAVLTLMVMTQSIY